jgi:hypothetical protein
MKRTTAFWVLWHAILICAVTGGFYAYRHHVLNRAITINNHYLDEGIPLGKLVPLIEGIAEKHPDCRVLSIRKNYHGLLIETAWVSETHKGIHFGFAERNGEWTMSYDMHSPIEGIPPSELLAILALTDKEPDDLMDKRVLSITILNGEVEIKTGVTNYSLGGGGNTLTFEKVGNQWVQTGWGHWIS